MWDPAGILSSCRQYARPGRVSRGRPRPGPVRHGCGHISHRLLPCAISFPKPATIMISPDTIRTAVNVIGE